MISSTGATAVNWTMLQGTHSDNLPALDFWGFVQGTSTHDYSSELTGLTYPQHPLP